MRLGGFVIHGASDGAMLGQCLDSLTAVCDEVVAVASVRPTDPGAPVHRPGVTTIYHRWEGYGAARAAAARALRGCDHLFFLDSDEWLGPEAIAAIRAWKQAPGSAPYHALPRRDHAQIAGRRFVYRTENHVRLVRMDAAAWDPSMIVHEALPPARTVRLDAPIEHRFADDVEAMHRKCERYALLWALRFQASPRGVKSPALQHAFHLVRELVMRGALFRGGWGAVALANAVARHHARKYELLGQVRSGAFAHLSRAFERGEYGEIFAALAGDGGRGLATPSAPSAPSAPAVLLSPRLDFGDSGPRTARAQSPER